MTPHDVLYIACTVVAITAFILLLYRFYTMIKDEARAKAEHAARMQSYHVVDQHYAEMTQRFGDGAAGLGIFNTPN